MEVPCQVSREETILVISLAAQNDDGAAEREMRSDCAVEACKILADQWPEVGFDARMRIMHKNLGGKGTKAVDHFGLVDISYAKPKCIAHAALQPAADIRGEGLAGAVTSVVVSKAYRGKGLGVILMSLLEPFARALDYTYIYLWTSTAKEFYHKCGYTECEKINLALPIFQKIDEKAMNSLETMLRRKQQNVIQQDQTSDEQSRCFDSEGAQERWDSESAVWMRKRLLENVSSVPRAQDSIIEHVRSACSGYESKFGSIWHYFCRVGLQWEKQVGPSCGLAAIRMVKNSFDAEQANIESSTPSLLQAAKKRGFSLDGEVFSVGNLAHLASEIAGLQTDVCDIKSCGVDDDERTRYIVQLIGERGSQIIFPYDRGLGSSLPSKANGDRAHYAILVGFCVPGNGQLEQDSTRSMKIESLDDRDQVSQHVSSVYAHSTLLVAQHGGGSNLLIAPAKEWLESNRQLLLHDKAQRDRLASSRYFCLDSVDLASKMITCFQSV